MKAYDDILAYGREQEAQAAFSTALVAYVRAVKLEPDRLDAHIRIQYLDRLDATEVESLVGLYHDLAIRFPVMNGLFCGLLGDLYASLGRLEESLECHLQSARTRYARKTGRSSTEMKFVSRLPNFLVVGFPKCATTSVYLYARGHPGVLPGYKKEVHFFDRYFNRGLGWYSSQFAMPDDESGLQACEATPHYMVTPGVEQRIAELPVPPKLIVCTRNPVERTLAHYYQSRRSGVEQRSLDEAMEQELSIVRSGLPIGRNTEGLHYILRSMYSLHLASWYELFDKSSFFFVTTERLAKDPDGIMNEVYAFLGLEEYHAADYPLWNVGSYDRAPRRITTELEQVFQSMGYEF